MNQLLIERLSEKVEAACKAPGNSFGYGIWTHHIKPMLPLARKLASETGADQEIVSIAVLLHDLAAIQDRNNKEDHHISGAILAETILKDQKYPAEKIERVKDCIKNHRGSVNNRKETSEEICVADADAIVHMLEISSLFYAAYREMNMTIDDGRKWISGKIERDWHKMSGRSRMLYESTYRTIAELLS